MFWQWIVARLAVSGLLQEPRQYYGTMPVRAGPITRFFFECPDCGWFHEEALQIDCLFLGNRYNLGTLPCGGETATEVHFLDGTIEKMARIAMEESYAVSRAETA